MGLGVKTTERAMAEMVRGDGGERERTWMNEALEKEESQASTTTGSERGQRMLLCARGPYDTGFSEQRGRTKDAPPMSCSLSGKSLPAR